MFKRHAVISDDMETSGDAYLFTDVASQEVSETMLNILDKDNFGTGMMQAANAKVFSVEKETGDITQEQVDIDTTGWINSRGYVDKSPGDYELSFSVINYPELLGSIGIKVTPNVWSYRDGKETPDGQYGYIIIPKAIRLEDDSTNKGKIVSNEKIKFLSYETDKRYLVTADESLNLFSSGSSETIQIKTKAVGGIIENNKIALGEIGNIIGVKSELPFTLEGTMTQANKRLNWLGKITFNFKQQ